MEKSSKLTVREAVKAQAETISLGVYAYKTARLLSTGKYFRFPTGILPFLRAALKGEKAEDTSMGLLAERFLEKYPTQQAAESAFPEHIPLAKVVDFSAVNALLDMDLDGAETLLKAQPLVEHFGAQMQAGSQPINTPQPSQQLTVTQVADEVAVFLNYLDMEEVAFIQNTIGDSVYFDIRHKRGYWFGRYVVGPNKCGPTQGDGPAWDNLWKMLWAHLENEFGNAWRRPKRVEPVAPQTGPNGAMGLPALATPERAKPNKKPRKNRFKHYAFIQYAMSNNKIGLDNALRKYGGSNASYNKFTALPETQNELSKLNAMAKEEGGEARIAKMLAELVNEKSQKKSKKPRT